MRGVWALARSQHGVVTRAQLLERGISARAIEHRFRSGRLHRIRTGGRIWRGVYGVGSPELTRRGRWMAAVLCCGRGAMLSHGSAAALWGIGRERSILIHVSVPRGGARARAGIRVHQRSDLRDADVTRQNGIPLTSPARTLIDLAAYLPPQQLERAVNEADNHDLIDPETLRAVVAERPGATGVAALRRLLDTRTFALTRSELERRFLPLARRAGLPKPETQAYLNGFEVDFYWPDLGLVVEADSLRYHRTAAEQTRDHERDQAHAVAGMTPLRFTHFQITYEPTRVVDALQVVARRVRRSASRGGAGSA